MSVLHSYDKAWRTKRLCHNPKVEVALARLRWYAWDSGGVTTGWRLHLAIEDPASARAWAVAAVDVA